jgi:hypothetical protein
MLQMKDVSKVYRTEMVETHALRDPRSKCAKASSSP